MLESVRLLNLNKFPLQAFTTIVSYIVILIQFELALNENEENIITLMK